MKAAGSILLALLFPVLIVAQTESSTLRKAFPEPAFLLHDKEVKVEQPRLVLGPIKTDEKGITRGSAAVYGGSSLIQVASLSFSADGRLLAVGSLPGRVDLWDVERREKVRTFAAGPTVALTPDGRFLVTDGNGLQVWDVSSGKLHKRIPWHRGEVRRLSVDPGGTRLLVSANGEEDMVYELATGQLFATLTYTQEGQFSPDGSLIVGGNAKHLVVWSTRDWTTVRDLRNGPDYVTTVAALPQKDLVVVGGPNAARLLQLSSAKELATLGLGYTNFAAFSHTGTVVLTYPSSGFAVWDTAGKQYCSTPDLGNGTVALSPDDRWLAAAPVNGGTDVMVWKVSAILSACGVP